MAITISGQNNNDKILASDGVLDSISGFNVVGVMTASTFDVTGNSEVSGKLTANHISIGNNIHLGNAGIITATTLLGNVTGNINHESNLLLQISGSEKFRVGNGGQFGIAGANYGTAGQVFTSGGSGSAPTWSTINSDKITEGNTEAEVVDTGSDGHFKVTTEGSERFRIASDGKIGINTTPSHSFEIFTGTDHENIIQVKGTNSAGVYAGMGVYQGNAIFTGGGIGSNSAGMVFRTAASGSEAERLRITSTGVVGITTDASGNGSGAKLVVGGRIQSNNGGYWFADANGAENGWHVQDSGGNLMIVESGVAERLRIGSSGQIGLGGANYGSSGQVLTSNGSGSAASWTTISGTTINNNANNRLITGSGTANTLEGEADLTFDKVNGVDPTFTFKRSSAASGDDNIYTELRFQNTSGTNMGQIICRRESSTDNAYLDFETKTDGENSQPSMRIKGQQGTAYFVGNLGRTNNNQPAYMSDTDYYSNTHLSSVNIQTRTNGGECGLFVRGRGQGGGSSAAHSCIRVDATSCANNADQYGIYLKGRQQLINDTTGIYADVYGSYSTTYCFRGHLQKQIGAYTTGTTFHSKITVTSSGGDAFHMRGYDGSSERIRINRNGDLDNTNNSYGSLSDVKLKENIVDANSQWNDIKALKVRNFNFKDDPDKVKMLGLVAQEAEAVSAGLVKTDNDIEIDESTGEGKVTGTTKYLKYSILYMKAIKALQEAQTRIETLESKVTALEGS